MPDLTSKAKSSEKKKAEFQVVPLIGFMAIVFIMIIMVICCSCYSNAKFDKEEAERRKLKAQAKLE